MCADFGVASNYRTWLISLPRYRVYNFSLVLGQAGQAVPKLMVMGSSTTSENTINTSTDSSNTVYTTVTVTDADQEQENSEIMENKTLLRQDDGAKSPVSGSQRSRELLSEFDELFMEHEKRIQREMEQSRKTSPRPPHERKVSRKGNHHSRALADSGEGCKGSNPSSMKKKKSSAILSFPTFTDFLLLSQLFSLIYSLSPPLCYLSLIFFFNYYRFCLFFLSNFCPFHCHFFFLRHFFDNF